MQSRRLFEFGPFRLDSAERLLLHQDQPVSLPPKAFDALVLLVENSGRLLEKEVLIQHLWPNTAVEENSLSQCIYLLRKTLGEDQIGGENQYIETVPRHGYRFVAPVRKISLQNLQSGHDDGLQPTTQTGRRSYRLTLVYAIAIVILVVLVSVGRWRKRVVGDEHRASGPPGPPSVAILPFLNLSGSSENEYLSDGFTEELTTALAEVRDLRVVARTSAFQFLGKGEDVRRIGEKLNVATVMEGSVSRSGDRLHVTAQLVSTQNGYHLWSRTYDVPQSQIYAIQQEIVRDTVRTLGIPPPRRLAHKYTASSEAHDLYLEGRYYWNKRDLPDMERSVQLFEAAIRKDPNFALAYTGLADDYVVMGGNGQKPLSEVVPHAKPALLRALELDPDLAEAHATLALLNSEISGERRDLVPELRRAVELSPGYASAHQWLGNILSAEGHFEEADAELRKAQLLDPLSPMITEGVAENFYYWRRYDDAITQVQRLRKMGSALGDDILGRAYVQKTMYHDAITVFSGLVQTNRAPLPLAHLAITYAAAGQNARARSLLREASATRETYIPPYWVAVVYLYLDEKDNTFRWLQRAYRQNDPTLGWMKVDPMLDPIRSDPRYLDLLRKADLND
jgi:TolB-like protein/DNA-binding winged helix-turn-helix (wHTH) protein